MVVTVQTMEELSTGQTKNSCPAKECIQADGATENKYSMITSNKIEFQKLQAGMWTSYQRIRQDSRLGNLDSIPRAPPFIKNQSQGSQQSGHYYSISVADILKDS